MKRLGLIALMTVGWVLPFAAPAQSNISATASPLADLTKPARKIPFKDVILATTQHRVLDFDTNNPAHVALHKKLMAAAQRAAEKAKAAGVTKVVFDRAGYRYHGRVQAVAEGAREGGLEF